MRWAAYYFEVTRYDVVADFEALRWLAHFRR